MVEAARHARTDRTSCVFIVISMVIAGLMQFYFLGSAQFMQDMGVSSRLVPAAMALAQIAQAAATWFLLKRSDRRRGVQVDTARSGRLAGS